MYSESQKGIKACTHERSCSCRASIGRGDRTSTGALYASNHQRRTIRPESSRATDFLLIALARSILVDSLGWALSWTIYSSVPLLALPRQRNLFGSACVRDRQIGIPDKAQRIVVLPWRTPMIELLWVNDAEEAQCECTRHTQLWERWSGRKGKASPFGICVRPADSRDTELPFPA
jgi:hypothetical protein